MKENRAYKGKRANRRTDRRPGDGKSLQNWLMAKLYDTSSFVIKYRTDTFAGLHMIGTCIVFYADMHGAITHYNYVHILEVNI